MPPRKPAAKGSSRKPGSGGSIFVYLGICFGFIFFFAAGYYLGREQSTMIEKNLPWVNLSEKSKSQTEEQTIKKTVKQQKPETAEIDKEIEQLNKELDEKKLRKLLLDKSGSQSD